MKKFDVHTINWVRWSWWALWFNAFWAAMGSWYLLGETDPMPISNLKGTPFSSYEGPGWILLLAVCGSSLIAAIWRSVKLPHAMELTVAAGAILMGWLLTEFWWIPQYWPVQFFFMLVAAVMMVGGYQGWKRGLIQTRPLMS